MSPKVRLWEEMSKTTRNNLTNHRHESGFHLAFIVLESDSKEGIIS